MSAALQHVESEFDMPQRRHDFVSRLPAEYRSCRFANYRTVTDYQSRVVKELQDAVHLLVDGSALNVVLYGPVGTGKDHLAVALAGCVIERHDSWGGGYLNSQEWFGRIRDAIKDRTPEREIICESSPRGVLVLSDPAPQIDSLERHQVNMLYRLAEMRAANGWPTITTLNVKDSREADAKIGAATFDRLKNRAIVVQCKWKSFRQPLKVIKPR